MELKSVLVFVCSIVSGCQAQNFFSCGYLATLECADLPTSEVCGTDGHTYINRCELGKVHCTWKDLDLKYDKACDPLDFSTTPHPTAGTGSVVATGDDVVLDFFCAYLPYKSCADVHDNGEYVCATDGRTYLNFCEYEKEKCTHRELHMHSWGNCTN